MAVEKEETSRKILFVLLILIIFVSILGTWTLLETLDTVQKQLPSEQEQLPPHQLTTSGYLVLELLPPEPKETEQDGTP